MSRRRCLPSVRRSQGRVGDTLPASAPRRDAWRCAAVGLQSHVAPCADTLHTCNKFWFAMHTGMQTDLDLWPCSLRSRQSARDMARRKLPKVCLAIALLALLQLLVACTVAGASSSVNSGEHLANLQSELPFKSDEPHHKLIITDKHPVQYVQYATSTAGSITSMQSTDTLGPSSAEFEVRFVSVKATWAIVWACPRRALTPSHLQRIDVNDAAAAADDHLITAKFSAAAEPRGRSTWVSAGPLESRPQSSGRACVAHLYYWPEECSGKSADSP